MEILAKRLKWLREKKRMGQKEVAAEIGMTLNAYQKYEGNERDPKLDVLVKLADIFNTTTDFLLGRDNYTDKLKELASTYHKYKSQLQVEYEKQSRISSLIIRTREQLIQYSETEGITNERTVAQSQELDRLINEHEYIKSSISRYSHTIGEVVWAYILELFELPGSSIQNDEFLSNHLPFDIDIQSNIFEEYEVLVYGHGLGMITVYGTFNNLEEAVKAKDELLSKLQR